MTEQTPIEVIEAMTDIKIEEAERIDIKGYFVPERDGAMISLVFDDEAPYIPVFSTLDLLRAFCVGKFANDAVGIITNEKQFHKNVQHESAMVILDPVVGADGAFDLDMLDWIDDDGPKT